MTDRDDSSEGFLGRWSRKKIDAEREAPDAPVEPRTTDTSLAHESGLPERQPDNDIETRIAAAPKPEFDLASLPSLDSITAVTDIRAFLGPGVPKELARAALRRAWTADPAIRDFKGLAENDWDFTDPNAMPGFGALPPGYDVKKLLAQIFGEGEKTADVNAASGRPVGPQPATVAEETAAPPHGMASAPAPEGMAEAELPDTSPDGQKVAQHDFVHRDNDIATHNSNTDDETEEPQSRRQHGGALPQ